MGDFFQILWPSHNVLTLQESINKLAMPKTKFFNYDILEGATAPARVKLLLPPGFREEELYTFALVVQV